MALSRSHLLCCCYPQNNKSLHIFCLCEPTRDSEAFDHLSLPPATKAPRTRSADEQAKCLCVNEWESTASALRPTFTSRRVTFYCAGRSSPAHRPAVIGACVNFYSAGWSPYLLPRSLSSRPAARTSTRLRRRLRRRSSGDIVTAAEETLKSRRKEDELRDVRRW
ncbi:hypothetical protein EVAR_42458_1 [Eumeta japonica]|uniref:Uncharacterized protein n=1 Tax=Eumeta variegata TaxID=151549 RepID=A0A4C1Y1S6_EUMVA|nr:hypothetical protein EVAR_42458_1 [Eumeta japonica]